VNQVQPGGSGFVFGSHCAHGTSAALFAALAGMKSPLLGQRGSDAGSLVTLAPGAWLPSQQLPLPSSSQKKSTPFGARLPAALNPSWLPMNWLPLEVSNCFAGSLSPRIAAGTQNRRTPERQLS